MKKKRYHKITNAFEAWWFIHDHPKFQRQIRSEIIPVEADEMEKLGFKVSRDRGGKCYRYHRHSIVSAIEENLSIFYTKTDGKRVNDDKSKNRFQECWLEFGSVEYDYLYGQPNEDWDDTTGEMNYHDWKLDCGGPTFDAALVQLAKNVRKNYGDYKPKVGRKGKCGPKPCADCAKTKACMKRLGLDKKTLIPPEPMDPEVIKLVEEWEKECGPLPKPPAGMFPWREPVVVETPKRSGVEVDGRGFFTIDGNLVPDTEAGRMRLQYALMNQNEVRNHENESIQGRSADCEPRQPDDERDRGNS